MCACALQWNNIQSYNTKTSGIKLQEIGDREGNWKMEKDFCFESEGPNPRPNEEVFNLNLNSSEDEKRYPNEQHL